LIGSRLVDDASMPAATQIKTGHLNSGPVANSTRPHLERRRGRSRLPGNAAAARHPSLHAPWSGPILPVRSVCVCKNPFDDRARLGQGVSVGLRHAPVAIGARRC